MFRIRTLLSLGSILVTVAGLVACGSSTTTDKPDGLVPGDVADLASDQRSDVRPDGTLADLTDVPENPDQQILPDADVADVDATPPDITDVETDTLADQMDRLFPGIRPECRPATLGCTADSQCDGETHCIGGGCVASVAPQDYVFSGQIQRVRGVFLPASSSASTFDFTGDGVPDNALADGVAMFEGGAELVNRTVQEYIQSGQYTYVVELRDVPTDGCGPVSVALFAGTSDTDQDGLPNDEADAAQVLWSNFREDGYGPAAQFNVAALDNGVMISGPGGSLTAPISLPDGTTLSVPLEGLRIRATLELTQDAGPLKILKFRPLDTPGAPPTANAELGGYIRLQSFVDEVNAKSTDCACSGIDIGSPVAQLVVENDKVKLQCIQSPDSQGCPEAAYGRFCPNLAAACLALPLMAQMADVASGQVKDGQGNPIPDALSLGLYVEISPSVLAEPPLAPDFGAVNDTWRMNPVCDLLQDDGPKMMGVLLNDFYDPTADPIIVSVGQASAGGTVAVSESGDRVSYTPPTGYYGFDDFSYVIQDASGNESSALVEVRISALVPYDPNLDCQTYCQRQCEQERVCLPDAYAAEYGQTGGSECLESCQTKWCPLWSLTSFCAQTQRSEVVCSSTLTCPIYQEFLEAVTQAEAGLAIPELTPCGGFILNRVARCGTCEAGFYSPECQECPGGALLPCGGNATCLDGSGGDGSCVCNTGYTFLDGECVDVDECATEPTPCGEHGVCGNRVGSYVCGCDQGYVSYGGTCAAVIDPCNPNPCAAMEYSPMHTCTLVPDSPKGYSCDCQGGYNWDPVLGACRNPNDVCDPNLCKLDPLSTGNCWLAAQTDFMCDCTPMFVHYWSWEEHRCKDPCQGFDCSGDINSLGNCVLDSSIGTPMCACKEGFSWSFMYGLCRNYQAPCDPDVCGLMDHGVPGTCQVVDTYSMQCDCDTDWEWNPSIQQCEQNMNQ